MKTFGTEFRTFYRKGRFSKKRKKFLTKFQRIATSGRHNYALIADRPKFTTKWSLYGMSNFHFCYSNQFKIIPLGWLTDVEVKQTWIGNWK